MAALGAVQSVAVVASGSGATQVVAAPGAGLKLQVLSWLITASAAVNMKFQSAANDKTGLMYTGVTGGYVAPHNPDGWFETNQNEDLNINLSGAVPVGGVLKYKIVQASS